MKREISLNDANLADRVRSVEQAVSKLVAQLRSRFPESDGYAWNVQEGLANWAWPSTISATTTEKDLLDALDPEVRPRAFRRRIRVSRGKRWGFYMDVQAADHEVSRLRLDIRREASWVDMGAAAIFAVSVVTTVGYAYMEGMIKGGRSFAYATFAGAGIGLVLAGLGWLASRPLEGMKQGEVHELMASVHSSLSNALAPHGEIHR